MAGYLDGWRKDAGKARKNRQALWFNLQATCLLACVKSSKVKSAVIIYASLQKSSSNVVTRTNERASDCFDKTTSSRTPLLSIAVLSFVLGERTRRVHVQESSMASRSQVRLLSSPDITIFRLASTHARKDRLSCVIQNDIDCFYFYLDLRRQWRNPIKYASTLPSADASLLDSQTFVWVGLSYLYMNREMAKRSIKCNLGHSPHLERISFSSASQMDYWLSHHLPARNQSGQRSCQMMMMELSDFLWEPNKDLSLEAVKSE